MLNYTWVLELTLMAEKIYNKIQSGSFESRCYSAGLKFQHGHQWIIDAYKHSTRQLPTKPLLDLTNQTSNKSEREKKRKATTEYKERRKRSKYSNVQGPSAEYGPNATQPDVSREELVRLCCDYKTALNVTSEEKRRIEQASDELWYQQRKCRLTASSFGTVAKRRSKTPAKNFVMNLLYKDKLIDTPSLRWGREHEDVARQEYAKRNGNIELTLSGLVIDATKGWLACSPDNLATDKQSKHGLLGLVEYKCPYSARHNTVTDAAKSKDFFASTKDGKVTLKRNHNYFFQIQGQMAICKRNWCDFVIWTTKEMTIERIIFDPKLWQETLPKLEFFYDKAILPELACP